MRDAVKTIAINNRRYELVCQRTSYRSAVYRGTDSYLRIGDPAPIAHELAIHKQLASYGFPVAPLLGEGEVCVGGVIDLESTRPGIAGYDIITGILTADLFPPDPSAYRFTSSQKTH